MRPKGIVACVECVELRDLGFGVGFRVWGLGCRVLGLADASCVGVACVYR
jgi:hypothetical protein